MSTFAERLLSEIQHATLSSEDRKQLLAALRDGRVGHPSVIAKWPSSFACVIDLCEWVAALEPEDLPPREGDAARYFGCSARTIGRYLAKTVVENWEGFLRFYHLAIRNE